MVVQKKKEKQKKIGGKPSEKINKTIHVETIYGNVGLSAGAVSLSQAIRELRMAKRFAIFLAENPSSTFFCH